MRKVVFLTLALLAVSQMALATEYTGSYVDVKAQSASLSKPILMEFYADW